MLCSSRNHRHQLFRPQLLKHDCASPVLRYRLAAPAPPKHVEEIKMVQLPETKRMHKQLTRVASRLGEMRIVSMRPVGQTSPSSGLSRMLTEGRNMQELSVDSASSDGDDDPAENWAADIAQWKDVQEMSREERMMTYQQAREAAQKHFVSKWPRIRSGGWGEIAGSGGLDRF